MKSTLRVPNSRNFLFWFRCRVRILAPFSTSATSVSCPSMPRPPRPKSCTRRSFCRRSTAHTKSTRLPPFMKQVTEMSLQSDRPDSVDCRLA
jgi:hypothetical protein